MLEWTGERFLPWVNQATIAYEHLHRYAYASTFVKGKRVLDLACGEGYGSKMMSETASSVVGIDIDDKAIQHAKAKYGTETLQFITGSISAVPLKDDHSFDVIVCFEAIEHIEDHDKLLGEVKRLLKADGTFIVSTPNKLIYHDEARDENPFHVKELYFEEFQQLLARHFKNAGFLGQRIHPTSNIWPIGTMKTPAVQELVIERGESEFQFISNDKRVPLYFIAIATDSTPVPQPGSVLVDHSDGLIRESTKAIEWRDQNLKDREEAISSLQNAVKWREDQIRNLNEEVKGLNEGLTWIRSQLTDMEQTVASREETVASHEKALAWRAHQVETLDKEKADLITILQTTQRQLNFASEQLEAVYASTGWKFILRIRHFRDSLRRLMGPGTSRGQQ